MSSSQGLRGLNISDPRLGVIALMAGIGVFRLVYGPHVYDAGELVAAASQLGGSHPPGQPLHALVAYAWTLLPLGPIPWRVSMLSLVTELGAVWVASGVVRRVLNEWSAVSSLHGGWRRWLPAVAAVGMVQSPPIAEQMLRPEVYGLALWWTLCSVDRLVRWSLQSDTRHAYVAAFWAGLAACVHPPHALAAAMCGLAIALVSMRQVWRSATAWVALPCAFFAGSLGYSYLVLRARAGALVWGRPQTWEGFWEYVSARAYRQNLVGVSSAHSDSQGWSSAGVGAADVLMYGVQATGWTVPLALALAWWLARGTESSSTSVRAEGRRLGWGWVVAAMLSATAGMLQPLQVRNPDNIAYLGTAVALWVCAGVCATGFVAARATRWARALAAALAVSFVVSFAVQWPVARALPAWLGHRATALETLGEAMVDTPPPDAFVLVKTDFTAAQWMAAVITEEARPDVAVLVEGLATSSWHWRTLRHYDLFTGSPVRAAGPTVSLQYIHGALRRAMSRAPVLMESEGVWHELRALQASSDRQAPSMPAVVGVVAGPYVWVPSHSADAEYIRSGGAKRSAAERVQSTLLVDMQRDGCPSSHASGAVLRHYEITRAKRFADRGAAARSFAAARQALCGLAEPELALLQGEFPVHKRPELTVVHDPDSFLYSLEDTVREAVALLWRAGELERIQSLLQAQLLRGDPRALLQLGWTYAQSGNMTMASQALEAFTQMAPHLEVEARPLRAYIQAPP